MVSTGNNEIKSHKEKFPTDEKSRKKNQKTHPSLRLISRGKPVGMPYGLSKQEIVAKLGEKIK